MRRTISTGMAACAAWVWMAAGATAFGEGAASQPDWAQGLCGAVEDGVRLLAENQLAPDGAVARAALVEALVRSAEFLDDERLAERSRRLASREWDAGLVRVAADGLPKVAAVRPESPAAAAGILPGERIEKVGGRTVAAGEPLRNVRQWLAEGEEDVVEVGVRAEGGAGRVAEVRRVRGEKALAAVEELPADMGYMLVAGLHPGIGGEVVQAVEQWRGVGVFGMILDLRGAAGQAEEEVAHVAALFADAGTPLYSKADRQGRALASVKAPAATAVALPTVVLVDEGTSGAAELLAAVLGGSVRGAMLVGRETAGDPLLREPLALPTGGFALLATRQMALPGGATFDGARGVRPDVPITDAALNETVYEPDAPTLRRGKTLSDEEKVDKALRDRTRHDAYLRRATDVLLGLQALGLDRR